MYPIPVPGRFGQYKSRNLVIFLYSVLNCSVRVCRLLSHGDGVCKEMELWENQARTNELRENQAWTNEVKLAWVWKQDKGIRCPPSPHLQWPRAIMSWDRGAQTKGRSTCKDEDRGKQECALMGELKEVRKSGWCVIRCCVSVLL